MGEMGLKTVVYQQVAVSHQKYRIASTSNDDHELEVQPVVESDDEDQPEDPDDDDDDDKDDEDDDEDQRVPQNFGIARSTSSSRMRTLFRSVFNKI